MAAPALQAKAAEQDPREQEETLQRTEAPEIVQVAAAPRSPPPEDTAEPTVQAKLTVGAPDDPLEREADRDADQVMCMPDRPSSNHELSFSSSRASTVQRKCVGREDGEETLRRKESGSGVDAPATVPPVVHEALSTPGQPLDPAMRGFFEPRFGRDFSDVRLHTDVSAAESAEAIAANAFAYGNHIAFAAGRYDPGSGEGKRLLAHELAHVEQAPSAAPRLWRDPTGEVTEGEIEIVQSGPTQAAGFERLEVFASGMADAAKVLAEGFARRTPKINRVFIGLNPHFLTFYDNNGNLLDKARFKDDVDLSFIPGIYVVVTDKLVAVTVAIGNPDVWSIETSGGKGSTSVIKKAKKRDLPAQAPEKPTNAPKEPKPTAELVVTIDDLIAEPAKIADIIGRVPAGSTAVYFVPTVETHDVTVGKKGGTAQGIYSSPIEGRGDGQPANAPPWPVSVAGPKLVPVDSDPTFSAKVDWAANANYTLASQVISQVGETIHYRWERFDITKYAQQQLAKDPAGTKDDPTAKPEKTLEQRIEDFKKSKTGTGTDVTGTGGAKREFSREFEDWWKDTKRAAKASASPSGDTVGEQLSNAAANRLSLELAPVSLLVTALGATLRLIADLFAGPRQQQEIPLEAEGIFLVRVITTPGINEDREGKPIIRPPSVAAKVVEVTPIDRAVRESLDEPGAQLAELQSQIDVAFKAGNTSKAEYLRSLLAEAKERFEGSPLTLLIKKRDEKQKELDKFRKDYPMLSDYSRVREVEMLDDQIALYQHHEKERTEGATGLAPLKRVNATLISEVTGEQYPLLLSAGPMAMDGSKHHWMISDVTNREGDAFTGLADTPSAAFRSALTKFGGKGAYGRGRIGVRTAGLGLEAGAPAEMLVDSAPADWALAEKRIDDLVTTLALLGLVVASAGTAGALIGAGVAAARLIERWHAGKLYLDAQTVSDALGLLGGLGAAGQLAGGLRVQKFEKAFAITQEGRATEAQLSRAAEALKGAQELAKVVEIANEAINYGGLLWGDISFIDQMMSISDQERSGAITHAGARRARAGAISSAVQNKGLFIAGNVLKAKHTKTQEKTPAQAEKAPTPTEKTTPKEQTTPKETVPTEPLPKDKLPGEEPPRQGDVDEPAGTARPEPVPIGERQATPAELRAALPADLQNTLVFDSSLHGDTVKAEYKLDPATGLISEIRLRCSPDARPASVALHTETIRTMQKYQGFSGRVRQAISWVGDLIGFETLSPEKNPDAFEAVLEIQKLPKLIDAQMTRMKSVEPNARDMAEAELDHLELQLDQHLRTLELGGTGEAAGFVAAKGLSAAKRKQYAELLAKLRGFEPGSDSHKKVRREMYELIGGDLPYATWEKIYTSNVEKATKASAVVLAEQQRLGWGNPEQTVNAGKDEIRRLDIANVKSKKGVEVKAYETGKIYASEDIVWEVERDAKLVKRGWEITWVLMDTEASAPLLKMLNDAGVTVEFRTRKGGGDSRLVTRILPDKSRAKAAK